MYRACWHTNHSLNSFSACMLKWYSSQRCKMFSVGETCGSKRASGMGGGTTVQSLGQWRSVPPLPIKTQASSFFRFKIFACLQKVYRRCDLAIWSTALKHRSTHGKKLIWNIIYQWRISKHDSDSCLKQAGSKHGICQCQQIFFSMFIEF